MVYVAGQSKEEAGKVYHNPSDTEAKELFLPFRCYCTKKAVSHSF